MESHEDFSNLLYDEVDENFEIDNPDGTGADQLPELKEGDPLLVDCVRSYPILYDKSLSGYKNAVMRENCWVAIGQAMNKEPASCAKRWGQLRESFSRERRKRVEEARSGSGLSKRKGFSLYTDMSFLEQHIQQRRTITNVSIKSVSKVCTPLMSTRFIANAPSFATFQPFMENHAIARPSSTVEIPPRPPRTPPSYIPNLTPPPSSSNQSPPPSSSNQSPPPSSSNQSPPPSSSNQSPPPKRSVLKSPPNMTAPTSALFTETLITSDITPTPILTLLPGLLTPTPSSSTPTPTPSPDTFMCSASDSSTYSSMSPSYPYSPSPPFYPRAMLSAIPHTSFARRPSKSQKLNSDMNSRFRSDPYSLRNASTTQSYPRSQTPSSAWMNNDVLEENLPSSLQHKFSQPTACFNNNLVKSKKIDPVESSFLSLSSALQNHLTNPARKETETKNVPCDDAFANLIATELANLDGPVRAAKKIRLLQVLYETE